MKLTKIKRPILYGFPNPRPLHTWLYYLDLNRLHIHRSLSVLNIRNFVTHHTTYQLDDVTYGLKEYWLQNAEDMMGFLELRKDDCDAMAQLSASICYSLGFNKVRLALGYCGEDADWQSMNHAYALYPQDDDYLLLECTGDDIIAELPLLSDCPKYHTLISADVFGDYQLHGRWAK